MSANGNPAILWQALYEESESGAPHVIGTLRVGDHGQLALEDADGDARAYLEEFVATVNDKAGIGVKAPPTDAEQRFELDMSYVPRGNKEFPAAVRSYARQYFSLTLLTAEELAERQAQPRDLE